MDKDRIDKEKALRLIEKAWRRALAEVFTLLDGFLEEKLLENPHKPIAELLREAGLVKSARAVEARNAPPPDGPSRRRTTASASRPKRS